MSDRFVTWGTRDGERRLFTFELDPEDAQIVRRVLPPAASSEDLLQTILNGWKQFTPIAYPEGTEVDVAELTSAGTIVPDGAEVEDKLRVASAEREWPFDVVSARMRKSFAAEFEEMRDFIFGLEDFDEATFERLKGTWDRVQREVDAKVLRYEHLQSLRKDSDGLFDRLKRLRRGKEKTVRTRSRGVRDAFRAKLAEAQQELERKGDLRKLFNRLREIQNEVNKAQLAREDRNKLRKSLDELFKATKSEIDSTGADAGHLSQQRERLESRLRGLDGALNRMEYSLRRDTNNIDYERRQIERSGNQLAVQLGAAKVQMLEQKTGGKQAKLDDMLATRADLVKKLEKLRKREERALSKKAEQQAGKANATPVASSDGSSKPSGKTRKRNRNRQRLVPQRLMFDVSTVVGLLLGEEPARPRPKADAAAQTESSTPAPEEPPATNQAETTTEGLVHAAPSVELSLPAPPEATTSAPAEAAPSSPPAEA